MERRLAIILSVFVWIASFAFLIPSPTRGLTLISTLTVMQLPVWMLDWPIVNNLVLLSYPISLVYLLVASWLVTRMERRDRAGVKIVVADVAMIVIYILLAGALWR